MPTLTRQFQVPKVRTAQYTDHFLLPVCCCPLYFFDGGFFNFPPCMLPSKLFLVFFPSLHATRLAFSFSVPLRLSRSLSVSFASECFLFLFWASAVLLWFVQGFLSAFFPVPCLLPVKLFFGGFLFSSLPPAH